MACKYLKSIDYKILSRNFRLGKKEIDIIAKNKKEIIFIEVKTRKSKKYGYPSEAVNFEKQRNIKQASRYFLYINKIKNVVIRYDIIEICYKEKSFFIKHLKNAFE